MHTSPDDGRVPQVPFGFMNNAWLAFKAKIQPGDKICATHSSPESWACLWGRAGYVLIRGDKVIVTLITRVS